MTGVKLIADGGATKVEWSLLNKGKKKTIFTPGISPYFLNEHQIHDLLVKELWSPLKNIPVSEIHYYGTGMKSPVNSRMMKKSLHKIFPKASIEISDDMLAAARALNGKNKGLACNLGTGSFCCYYNGKKIVKESPGMGYVLGDEGSGAYLGKKVLQYYLYKTFDKELLYKFEEKYKTGYIEILENVYRKPLANRYLASFSLFLHENRGHYMIENILEDGLNDFFYMHLCKYREVWTSPVHFVGSIAYGFKDIIQQLCNQYEFELGAVLKNPMEGLIEYHS
jgi:N-acetylglucosamine kinase-like BadF-type ATPase